MTSRMTAPAGTLCDHCLLPIGPRPMRRMVNGESRAFCCYGCCIAYQVKGGNSEEWEAAWLLIRLGVVRTEERKTDGRPRCVVIRLRLFG